MKYHEYVCFLRDMDLTPNQLVVFDALKNEISDQIIEGYDGLIIGGNGDYSVLQEYDFIPGLEKLLKHCYEIDFPVFGVCFGMQLMAKLFGGQVVSEKKLRETQTVVCQKNENGEKSLLYKGLPEEFPVQAFHNDTVVKLPEGAIATCSGPNKESFYAMEFVGKKMFGVQFHLELTKEDCMIRLNHYMANYVDGGNEEYEQIKSNTHETKEVGLMLKNFLQVV